jgi:glycosyltransferase involved in cell wall biosynthesis
MLLRELASTGIQLVFIGKTAGLDRKVAAFESLLAFPNVRHLGLLHPRDFYPVLSLAAAGLVTYRHEKRKGRAVLKYLHYLAAGKPVITNTPCGPADLADGCVFETQHNEKFVALCRKAAAGELPFNRKLADAFVDSAGIDRIVGKILLKL